jgi:hypothetical protein
LICDDQSGYLNVGLVKDTSNRKYTIQGVNNLEIGGQHGQESEKGGRFYASVGCFAGLWSLEMCLTAKG